jgi:hypothetical protein
METQVKINVKQSITELLYSYGYIVKRQSDSLMLVTLKDYETPLILVEDENELYFQLDIIEMSHLVEDINLYKMLLRTNTELAPLALAIDDSREEDEVLVLIESIDRDNIDDRILIGIIEHFEDSIIKIAVMLKNYINVVSYTTEGEE